MARFGTSRLTGPLHRAARIERILSQKPALADDAQHFTPPSKRELRTQAVHRLQVGLLGLAAILLLIALASAIMQHARLTADAAALANGEARAPSPRPSSGPGDPLADMGVAPEMRAGRAPGAAAPAPRAAPAIPQDPARAPHTP